jgi:hypothetical protein
LGMKRDLEPQIRAQRQGDFTNNSIKHLKPPILKLIAWVVDTFNLLLPCWLYSLKGSILSPRYEMRHDDNTNCSPNVCDNCYVEKKGDVLENNSSNTQLPPILEMLWLFQLWTFVVFCIFRKKCLSMKPYYPKEIHLITNSLNKEFFSPTCQSRIWWPFIWMEWTHEKHWISKRMDSREWWGKWFSNVK